MHSAVASSSLETVKILVDALKNQNRTQLLEKPNTNGHTPLQFALMKGNEQIFLFLQAENFALKTSKDLSLLHMAVKAGHLNIVKILINQMGEREINESDGQDCSPLTLALEKGNEDIFLLLLERGEQFTKSYRDKFLLHKAVEAGHLNIVKILIDRMERGEIDQPDNKGYSPVQLAMEKGHEQIFLLLLERGARFTTHTSEGKSLDCFNPTILEEYFNKSNNCIKIDNNRNTMELNFRIFQRNNDLGDSEKAENQYIPQQSHDSEITSISRMVSKSLSNKETERRSFLDFLVKDDIMQPLCKHPFISAFIEIHYSPLKKLRAQIKDSVAHLAIILLLLELAATIPGSVKENHKYFTVLGSTLCGLMMALDLFSHIGLHTEWINKLFRGSFVGSIGQPTTFFTYLNWREMHNLIMHPVGYLISVTMLVIGSELEDNHWKVHLLHVTMIIYAILLATKEAVQLRATEFRLYIRRDGNQIDIMAIIAVLVIVGIHLYSCLNSCGGNYFSHADNVEIEYPPWITYLILGTVLQIWFQLCLDILQCLPISNIEQYLHMYVHVARSYFKILVCFSPLMIAFAGCFKGKFQRYVAL